MVNGGLCAVFLKECMRYSPEREPLWIRMAAGMAALAMLSALARLMLQMPELTPARQETRTQLRWLASVAAPPVVPAPALPDPASPNLATPAPPPSLPAVSSNTAPAAAPPPFPAPVKPPAVRLYGADGEALLAADTVKAETQKSNAERVFEHRDELATGVGERATAGLFSGKSAGTSQSRAQRALYGRDIQAAEARRPPDIAFNPRLHERSSDLGSEATGDAYKAAPIRYEKAPDLKGEASRRIRSAIGVLEQRYPRCSSEQRQRWLGIAQQHLDALQRVEYRFNHGADPVEAEHSLPSAADSAYDLARRALWDAERRMKMCT